MRESALVVFLCVMTVRGQPPPQSLQPLPPPPSGYENSFNPNAPVTNYGQNVGPEENQLNYPNFQQPQELAEQQSSGPGPETQRSRGSKSFEGAEELPSGEDDGLISEAIPGEPEQDYPVFNDIPKTSFTCSDKTFPGYFADIEARCQVFHICEVGGVKHSFLCPSGSVFNQKYLVCDWWYDFVCENVQDLFQDQQDLDRLRQQKEFPAPVSGVGEAPVSNPGVQGGQYEQPDQSGFIPSGQGQNGNNYGFPDDGINYQGNNNGFFPPNDIFHGAETGVPNRNRNYENENQENDYSNNQGPDNVNNNSQNNTSKQNDQFDSNKRINSELRNENNGTTGIYNAPKKDSNIGLDNKQRQNLRANRRGNQFPAQIKLTEQTLKDKPLDAPGPNSNFGPTRTPDGNPGRFSGNQYLSTTPETLNNRESDLLINKNVPEKNGNAGFPGPTFNSPIYQTPAPLK